MELYCITATFKDGTQRRQYAISRFAAGQRHAEFENLEGVECVTTDPFNVPARSYSAMAQFLNDMEKALTTSKTWPADDPSGALDRQEGGDHYKDLPIQPVEFIHANQLTFLAGNVVKYISRYRAKGGADDVRKAIHYCQLILDLEYGNGRPD